MEREDLLYVFPRDAVKEDDKELWIVRDGVPLTETPSRRMRHYSDPFEDLVRLPLPPKMHKTEKLLSYDACWALLQNASYVNVAFQAGAYPYVFSIDQILLDHHLYFHCAFHGHKMDGIAHKIALNACEDLGIQLEVGTHNFKSVHVYGELLEVVDPAIKKQALLALCAQKAPSHPYHDRMIETTCILEATIDYMIGRFHIYPKQA